MLGSMNPAMLEGMLTSLQAMDEGSLKEVRHTAWGLWLWLRFSRARGCHASPPSSHALRHMGYGSLQDLVNVEWIRLVAA